MAAVDFYAGLGLDELEAIALEHDRLSGSVLRAGESEQATFERLVDEYVAGMTVDDAAGQLAAAAIRESTINRTAAMHRAVAKRCREARSDRLIAGADDIYSRLAAEATRITAAVKKLGNVPTDAEAAIAGGKVDEFQKARQLVNDWDRVSRVRNDIARLLGGDDRATGSETTDARVTIRQLVWVRPDVLVDWWPPVVAALTGAPARRVWPGYIDERMAPRTPVDPADELAWLVWAGRHDALWAPTHDQLADAWVTLVDELRGAYRERNGEPASTNARVDTKTMQLAAPGNGAARFVEVR